MNLDEMVSKERKEKDAPFLGGGATVKYRGGKWEMPLNINSIADIKGDYIRISRDTARGKVETKMVNKKLLKEGQDGLYIDEDMAMEEAKTFKDYIKKQQIEKIKKGQEEQKKKGLKEGTMLIKGLDVLKKKVKGSDKKQLDGVIKILMPKLKGETKTGAVGGPSIDNAKKTLKALVAKYGGTVAGKKESVEEGLSVPEKHQLKIARDTLKMPDTMAKVMGGPTKEEAKKIIAKLTKKEGEELTEGRTISWKNVDKSKKWHLVLNGKPLAGKYEDMYKAQSGKTRLMKKTGLGPGAKYTTAELNKIEILPIPFKSRAEYEKHMKSQQEGVFLTPGMEGSRAALKSGAFIKVKEISQPNIKVVRTTGDGAFEIGRTIVVTEDKLLERVSIWLHLVPVKKEGLEAELAEAKVAVGKWTTKGGETITVHSIKGGKATITGDDAKKRDMDVDALKYILRKPIKEGEEVQEGDVPGFALNALQDELGKMKNRNELNRWYNELSKGNKNWNALNKIAKNTLITRIKLKERQLKEGEEPVEEGTRKWEPYAVITQGKKHSSMRMGAKTASEPGPPEKAVSKLKTLAKKWGAADVEVIKEGKKSAVIMRDMSGKWYAEVGGKKIDSDQDESKLRGRLKGKYELSEGLAQVLHER